jgi:hypothetical protein
MFVMLPKLAMVLPRPAQATRTLTATPCAARPTELATLRRDVPALVLLAQLMPSWMDPPLAATLLALVTQPQFALELAPIVPPTVSAM